MRKDQSPLWAGGFLRMLPVKLGFRSKVSIQRTDATKPLLLLNDSILKRLGRWQDYSTSIPEMQADES